MTTKTWNTTYNEEIGNYSFKVQAGFYFIERGGTTFYEDNSSLDAIKAKMVETDGLNGFGIGLKCSDATISNLTGYFLLFDIDSNEIELIKYDAGSEVGEVSYTPTTSLTTGQIYEMEVVMTASNTFVCYLDDDKITSWSSSSGDLSYATGTITDAGAVLSTGKPGFLGWETYVYDVLYYTPAGSSNYISTPLIEDKIVPITPEDIWLTMGFDSGERLDEFTSETFPSLWDVMESIADAVIKFETETKIPIGVHYASDELHDLTTSSITTIPPGYEGEIFRTEIVDEGFIALDHSNVIKEDEIYIIDGDGNETLQTEGKGEDVYLDEDDGKLYIYSTTGAWTGVERIKISYWYGKEVDRQSQEYTALKKLTEYFLENKRVRSSVHNEGDIKAEMARLDAMMNNQIKPMIEEIKSNDEFEMI